MPLVLARWVGACVRRAGWVVLLAALLAVGAAWLAYARLGVTTDTSGLFAESLPWRQRSLVLQRAFPQNEDLLVAVVDGATPEETEATAEALAAKLRSDRAHFQEVRRPDSSPYLEQNGLLFLDRPQLAALLDQTIDSQPFLGQLARDPSLRGLLGALALIADGVEVGQANLEPFEPALRGFHTALAQAAAGRPEPLSWQRLLAGSVSDLAGRYRFVLTRPVLDYGGLEPGAAAAQALRTAAAGLEFVRNSRAHVRLTGSVALDNEEFATVAEGAIEGLVGSVALVTLLLFLAVRTWRLMVPILLTLGLGLLLTTGFAALAVGTLNLVSMAFAVLFVGIAVDFAIQLSVRFREGRSLAPNNRVALERTARRVGGQVLVAALASMAGFIAFTPTNFVGVAQLGLVAGVGMMIAFACTVTFLPAMLSLCRPGPGSPEVGLAWLRPLDPILVRRRWPVLLAFAALAAAGAALAPHLEFDSDPLHTKDPDSEAVRTLHDLTEDPVTNPYTIEILTSSVAEAAALGARLKQLPLVGDVLSLRSFVPEDQAEKLPLVADAAGLLRTTLAAGEPLPHPDAAELRRAAQTVAARLDGIRAKLPPGSTVLAITADLQTLAQAPDPVLLGADAALTRFLPLQLDRLRRALDATGAAEADIPPEIRRDWVLPDGRAKVQVVPKREAQDSAGLHRFVAQVQAAAPDATGAAVTITAAADTITSAFRTAFALAVLAIMALLFAALRRALDVALVLAPLLLSALLTVALAVLLPLPLNFANIIALPLLLGVGVSFNVYFVMDWRAGRSGPLGSATARAVLFSAMTTATAFGALALSRHPGTASMGKLLLLSLGCTVVTTLLFMPALLARMGRPR